jgi:hypothetical protein
MKYPKKQIAIIPISCCLLATLVRAQDPASDPRYIPPPTPTITDPKNNQAQQSPTTNIAGRTAVITDGDEPVPNEEDVLPSAARGRLQTVKKRCYGRQWARGIGTIRQWMLAYPATKGKNLRLIRC